MRAKKFLEMLGVLCTVIKVEGSLRYFEDVGELSDAEVYSSIC